MRCGNQKVMGTLDSLLLYGACLYVEGCHYREYNTFFKLRVTVYEMVRQSKAS